MIRAAHPADAAFLAWAILCATRGHLPRGWFDIVLDRPEAACLGFLKTLTQVPTPSWWHWSRFLVAEVDGSPAAALARFRAGEAYPLSEAALAEAVAALGWGGGETLERMGERGGYLFTCTIDAGPEAWTIENVATVADRRGRGLATALVGAALQEGACAGHTVAHLSVLIGNDVAERVYRRRGFRVMHERRHPTFEAVTGSPGLRHLACPLPLRAPR